MSQNVPVEKKCPDCGASIPPDAPTGFCPRCEMKGAIDFGQSVSLQSTMLVTAVPQGPFGKVRYFGDYELLEEIARGGMGVVYKARQMSLSRLVALKMILPGRLASSEMVRRFQIEAEAAAKLDHPNIVPIYAIGEHEEQHYFSMKLIEGQSLAEAIANGQFTFPTSTGQHLQGSPAEASSRIAMFMVKMARAVHHAHQHGVLHRDLKPRNILLDEQSEPYLMDFGLAKLVEHDHGQTLSQAIMGTPSYMSPEQAAGKSKSITTAADIYSLGAICYEMLTCQPLFRGESAPEILEHVLHTEPVRPRLINPAIPPDLETICLKCVEKQPGRRYPSAEALAQDLERWLRGEPITARPASLPERTWKWMRRHPGTVRLAAMIFLSLLLGTAGLGQWRRAERHRQAATLREIQSNLKQAEEYFLKDNASSALATLAQMLHRDPANRVVAERLLNALDRHGFLVPRLPVFTNAVSHGRFSGDGQRLVLAAANEQENLVQVYDPNGELLTELPLGKNEITTIDVSRDGSVVATSTANKVDLWDVAQKRTIGSHAVAHGGIRQIRLLPDKRALVVATNHIALLQAEGASLIREFDTQGEMVLQAAVAPSARLLAAGYYSGTIQLWSLDSGKSLHTVTQAHTKVIRDLQFSTDGTRLVSAAADSNAWVWDPRTGRPATSPLPHGGTVTAAAFNPAGDRVVTASRDRKARIWDTQTGGLLGTTPEHNGSVSVVRFSPDGRQMVSASEDGTVRLWNAADATPLTAAAHFPARISDVWFRPEIRTNRPELLVLVASQEAHLVVPTPLRLLKRLEPELVPPEPPALAARFAQASVPNLKSCDLSPDTILVATVSSNNTAAHLWNRKSGKHVMTLTHERPVNWIHFSPDGLRLVTCTTDNRFRVWDVATGAPLTDEIDSDESVPWVWFAFDRSMIVVGGSRLWELHVVDEPVPSWLPELAEAVIGKRLGTQSGDKQELQQVPANALFHLQQVLAARSETDRLTVWAKNYLGVRMESP